MMTDHPTDPSKHTLDHALAPRANRCRCFKYQVTHCVMCDAELPKDRKLFDTCSEECFKRLCVVTAERYHA